MLCWIWLNRGMILQNQCGLDLCVSSDIWVDTRRDIGDTRISSAAGANMGTLVLLSMTDPKLHCMEWNSSYLYIYTIVISEETWRVQDSLSFIKNKSSRCLSAQWSWCHDTGNTVNSTVPRTVNNTVRIHLESCECHRYESIGQTIEPWCSQSIQLLFKDTHLCAHSNDPNKTVP